MGKSSFSVPSVPLEVLDFSFVLLRGLARAKCSEVATTSGLGVRLSRVKPEAAGGEFADHGFRGRKIFA